MKPCTAWPGTQTSQVGGSTFRLAPLSPGDSSAASPEVQSSPPSGDIAATSGPVSELPPAAKQVEELATPPAASINQSPPLALAAAPAPTDGDTNHSVITSTPAMNAWAIGVPSPSPAVAGVSEGSQPVNGALSKVAGLEALMVTRRMTVENRVCRLPIVYKYGLSIVYED